MDIFYFETRNDYFVQELRVGKPSSFYTTFTSNYVQTGSQFFIYLFIVFSGSAAQRGLWPPRFTRFLDNTQRRATVGRTPLDE
jgi:hypothetical protein